MEIVVIDGQGGGIGKNIIQVLKEKHPEYTIIGVGTNSMATTQLKKGGADIIATGENAVVYNVTCLYCCWSDWSCFCKFNVW